MPNNTIQGEKQISLGKGGQEELVGFVLVVVIVVIAGLILLSLLFRLEDDVDGESSGDIAQFLESTFYTTSACHTYSPTSAATIGELVNTCAGDKEARCREGTRVCEMLNSTLPGLITGSWGIDTAAAKQGYMLQIERVSNRTRTKTSEVVLSLHGGTCSGPFRAGEHLQPGSQRGTVVVTTLKLCSS